MSICDSGAARSACSMRCWPRSPKPDAMRCLPRCATSCAFQPASSPLTRPPDSAASCVPINGTVSVGFTSCGSSASAAVWPTTWAWARRCRCWPCWRRGGNCGSETASAQEKRAQGPRAPWRRRSLVVVPKSLVFNWKQEAARFAPRLRVLDHTGVCAAGQRTLRGLRSRADHLRHAAQRCRRFQGRALRLRHSRRGAGDQERRLRVGQGRAAAARRTTASRSAARRSRITWASCGACSSS